MQVELLYKKKEIMQTLIFIGIGILTVALGLMFWSTIQKSRAKDKDFEIRDEAAEELAEGEPII